MAALARLKGVVAAAEHKREGRELLYLLDEAFRGRGIEDTDESQALLPNLGTVPDEAWRAVPDGGVRSIEAIAVSLTPRRKGSAGGGTGRARRDRYRTFISSGFVPAPR